MQVVHIGFDISRTGSGKAGCDYFDNSMLQAMLELVGALALLLQLYAEALPVPKR